MGVKSVALAVLVLGMISGQATANFALCYAGCYALCIIDMKKLMPSTAIPKKKLLHCAMKCLKHCLFHGAGPNTASDYCNLGCSLSRCEEFIDDANKVESCALNCSNNLCKATSLD